MTRTLLLIVTLLLTACSNRVTLVSPLLGDTDGGLACAPVSHVLEVPDAPGCVSVEVQGGGDGLQGCLGSPDWRPATAIELRRAGARPVTIEVEVLSFGGVCDAIGDPTPAHARLDCPRVAVPQPSSGPGCPCTGEQGEMIARVPLETADIPGSIGTLEMRPRSQVVYALRQDSRYRITACARDLEPSEDPWPHCGGSPLDCDGLAATVEGDHCACEWPCASDSDCPTPSSGDASPACRSGLCVLPCDSSTMCPDAMSCGVAPSRYDFGTTVCLDPAPAL